MTLRDIGHRLAYGMDQRAPFAPPSTTAPAHLLGGGDAVSQPADTMIDPATIEARCRRLMAEHAATKARGWDSERTRADLHAEIDAWLDEWNAARS